MEPEETLDPEFVIRQESTAGLAEESTTKLSRTYVGRDSVTIGLGSFEASKHTSAEATVAGKAGKYAIEQVADTTKVTRYDMK